MADSLPAETLIPGAERIERRRGSRLMIEIPITVMGMDTLGQPFKESALTASVSCYGCKYRTRRYAPQDSLVTLEIKPLNAPGTSRIEHARVVWVQRPRHHRETFQIGLDLESPGNVWGIDSPPADWFPPANDTIKPRAVEEPHVEEPRVNSSATETAEPHTQCEPSTLATPEWETLHLPEPQHPATLTLVPTNGAASGKNPPAIRETAKITADSAIAEEIALLRKQFTGRLESALLETLKTFSDLAGEIVKETREACRLTTKEMESEIQKIAREARSAGEKSLAGDRAPARRKHRSNGP